ncbi:MAG TPA: YCF48-related protein [Bacteroidales bacterium]|nr:YCF48-related protein [Bacteroidales bacterium]HQI69608.1 YCF48-related protein [Bacteroidales bacterium]
MKKNSLFIVTLCIINLTNAQWVSQTSNTSKNLRAVLFLNTEKGFVVGDSGVILKTMNGGIVWSVQPSFTPNDLKSIFFADSNIGYTVGQYGRIYKTTNGGDNWSSFTGDTTYDFNSVHFISADTGYIVGTHGDNGIILKTVNGGANWLPQSFSYGQTTVLYSVHFGNSNYGSAVGYYYNPYNFYPLILITADGGNTWSPKYPIGKPLKSVFFLNADTSYAVGWSDGSHPTILKTTDGWNASNTQYYSANRSLSSVYFPVIDTGYAVGSSGTILQTTDGGSNWNLQPSNTNIELSSVFFLTSSIGYASGASGTILKTTDGGIITNAENIFSLDSEIEVFPNPAKDMVEIRTQPKSLIEIINIYGQLISATNTTETNSILDLSKFSSGIYFIRIKTNNLITIKRLIKE